VSATGVYPGDKHTHVLEVMGLGQTNLVGRSLSGRKRTHSAKEPRPLLLPLKSCCNEQVSPPRSSAYSI
jgi:hypothetical protein